MTPFPSLGLLRLQMQGGSGAPVERRVREVSAVSQLPTCWSVCFLRRAVCQETGPPSPSSLLPPPSPRRETTPSRCDAVGPADRAQPASRPRSPSSAAGRALGRGVPVAAAPGACRGAAGLLTAALGRYVHQGQEVPGAREGDLACAGGGGGWRGRGSRVAAPPPGLEGCQRRAGAALPARAAVPGARRVSTRARPSGAGGTGIGTR